LGSSSSLSRPPVELRPIREKKVSSSIVCTPSSDAFFIFSGPGLLPARRYVVLDDTEDEFLPPLSSMSLFISSLEIEKFPDMTMVFPARDCDAALRVSMVKLRPASLSFSTSCTWEGVLKKEYTLSATTSPTSGTALSSSRDACASASMFSKWRARVFAVVSPTYLMPRAKSTLSKGTPLDCCRESRNLCAARSFQPSSLTRSIFRREYRSDGVFARPRL